MSNDRYSIFWTSIAKQSYVNELDFIKYKWNLKEVEKFMHMVEHQLLLLSNNVLQGRLSVKTGIYKLMISKQTSLFYVYRKDKKQIDLLLFWNNSKNPKALKNLLSKFKS
ncbi:hypothetical protein [Psychroflexus sp. MBR-150]|jgi:hypothetical protein